MGAAAAAAFASTFPRGATGEPVLWPAVVEATNYGVSAIQQFSDYCYNDGSMTELIAIFLLMMWFLVLNAAFAFYSYRAASAWWGRRSSSWTSVSAAATTTSASAAAATTPITPSITTCDAWTQAEHLRVDLMNVDAMRELCREWGLPSNRRLRAELEVQLTDEAHRRADARSGIPR